MADSAPHAGRLTFGCLVGASQLLGLASVVLTGVWMGHYHGGYAWDGSGKEFNVHPLCMVLGLVFLQGDAVLVYRVFRNEAKRTTKLLHGIIHLLALILGVIGVVAVFDFHGQNNIPHMYSLHSWMGMVTVLLFCIQWLLGLLFFLFPGASSRLRALYLPVHVFSGLVLFVLAIGSCLLGIMEKLLFSIMLVYAERVPEGVLANVLGILLVAFGVLMCYLITKEEYKRPPNPEEEALSLHFKSLTEESPASP
ncbi:transmembrane ascorbate-dependent reductase CYB561 [Brachionichthys hirsutus]|uniref:transmembrane ascorbate-dependent reductase CYB561 n=1 Tax=Brachionichthys hirsutus TaxID=412623 RepID=UPI003604E63C